jgi:hypothetical protein
MLEAARILGSFSAVLLIVAVTAWLKLVRGPDLQRLDGQTMSNPKQAEFASRLLVLAAGLSAISALLACVGWIAND